MAPGRRRWLKGFDFEAPDPLSVGRPPNLPFYAINSMTYTAVSLTIVLMSALGMLAVEATRRESHRRSFLT